MTDDDLRDWAESRRRTRPTPDEAQALVARWQHRRSRRWVVRGGLGMALVAAAVLLVVVSLPTAPEAPDAPPIVEVPEVRSLGPGHHEADGDRIELAAASALTIARPGQLVLTAGTVRIEARKRPREAPLTVQAGDASVVVVGTQFSLTLEPLRVVVTEGIVAVLIGDERHLVRAGEIYPPPPEPEAPPLPSVDALRQRLLQGDLAGARRGLDERLSAVSSDAEAWVLLAQLESRAGRTNAARRAWREVVAHGRPRTARRARFELARLLEDRPEEAIPWLEAYLDDPGPWVAEARLRLGQAQRVTRHPDAEDTLRRVIADHPGTAAAATARALLGDPK